MFSPLDPVPVTEPVGDVTKAEPDKALVGAWEDSGATSLTVRSRQPEAIEVMAQAARLN